MNRFLIFLLLIAACTTNESPNVLPKEKMLHLMEEIYLLENHYQMTYGSPSVYKASLDSSFQRVLKENGVTLKQFEESFSYYAEQPEEMLHMQQQLIENLNRKRVGL
jgi:hypothetical protein